MFKLPVTTTNIEVHESLGGPARLPIVNLGCKRTAQRLLSLSDTSKILTKHNSLAQMVCYHWRPSSMALIGALVVWRPSLLSRPSKVSCL
jgi:hypothetical protein